MSTKPSELGMDRLLWWVAMLTSLLCVFLIFRDIKRDNEAKPCECKCFEAGYDAALDDMQLLAEPKVTRSREDY